MQCIEIKYISTSTASAKVKVFGHGANAANPLWPTQYYKHLQLK